MKSNNSRIILEEQKNDFLYKENKSNLNITFNRVAFIFFVFYYFVYLFNSSYSPWFKKR